MKNHVLVIDDDAQVQRMIVKALQQASYDVSTSASAEAGLRLLRESPFSLLILDAHLPGMSGIEACQAVKRDARTSAIPILLITGDDKEGRKLISGEPGADDYLPKPFNVNLLVSRVSALLRSERPSID